jgi:hypothetical protein
MDLRNAITWILDAFYCRFGIWYIIDESITRLRPPQFHLSFIRIIKLVLKKTGGVLTTHSPLWLRLC